MSEEQIAVVETERNFESLKGIIAGLIEIAEDPKAKPMEKLRALDKIAELKGLKIDRQMKDLRFCSAEELNDIILNVVLPTLSTFGVESGSPKLLIDEAASSKASD